MNESQDTINATVNAHDSAEPDVQEDLLVEDVSIDGMCGVY
ncbi:mycofactocin precursor [Streptomyces sp. V4I23]|nr:mycofactocin precursor MftA [Streptomyces sp. V4I23]MDQ1012114.1 mycofactocin precursor [Streptomyces sp. V4I23]